MLIDGDGGSDYDEIGTHEVTMGKLMGAKKQMHTANLEYQGNTNRGQIIVRCQAIEQTNEVAKWRLRLTNARNTTGGCMGMCGGDGFYTVEI